MDVDTHPLSAAARVGGHPALDFVNTVNWRGRVAPDDLLRSYADLVQWAQHGELVTTAMAQALLGPPAHDAMQAQVVLDEARGTREVLYRLFAASEEHRPPDAADVAAFNNALGSALAHIRLRPVRGGFEWAWGEGQGSLAVPLWPVLRAAADLLTGPELHRIRQCADRECGWLFLDSSKNGSRRWCSMAGCGSRAKARSYYRRKQTGE
ncbi:MAG TPA: ABATE domain-containing protein [Chloroflexia bacterium]|nr:ABATE domain-containing protein [Chloroflexia bacterium]